MRLRCFCKYLIISILVIYAGNLAAQTTRAYHSPEHEYKLANELFIKQQYTAAKEMFGKVYQSIEQTYDPRKESSLYYQAVCACLLYHEDAESLALQFADIYPEYAAIGRLWFYLGNYYFEKKQYKKALSVLDKTSEQVLEGEEIAAYRFKRGYSYFMLDLPQNAKPLLLAATLSESQYKNKAIFYYSHILYTEGNYKSALDGFEQLKSADTYSEIVPFYIAHIYFSTGRYDSVVVQSEHLLAKTSTKRLPEINRIIAHSYFKLQSYPEAVPYFEKYFSTATVTIESEDYYMAGYCYYVDKEYNKAITYLTKSVYGNDSIKQYALFTLGDCYLQTQQKEFASRAFLSAYEVGKNPFLTEDALFEYAKLQYELASNPFVGAISSFEKYLNEYPNSNRRNEAEIMLANIYLTTKNYKAALTSLQKINNKSKTLLKAYQRVACFRGMELFNDGNLDDADAHFDLAIANNFDPVIYAQSIFWKGEIAYQRGDYTQAKTTYNHFLSLFDAAKTNEYYLAYYNGGYADFKLKNYRQSLDKFLEFQKLNAAKADKQMLSDATNRAGDCYFMLSNLPEARSQYQKVIDMNAYDVDYALYQRATAEGGSRDLETKINTLRLLQKKYPKSRYMPDAQYEIANTYYALGIYRTSITEFETFVNLYPKHPLTGQAMLKIGSIYYNLEEDDNAIDVFKSVVEKYPNSNESAVALKSIENIYSANGTVDDFFTYVRSLSFTNITLTYQDSITYNSAADKYFDRKFADAEKGFDNYITKFPQGVFITNAHFYRAECALSNNNLDKAVASYEYVIEHPAGGQFTALSLLAAAKILYQKENYAASLTYFQELTQKATLPTQTMEAWMGESRCFWQLKQYDSAIVCAQKLLSDEKAPKDYQTDAHAIIARSAMTINDIDLAQKEYLVLSKESKSEINSEAYYNLAYIAYKSGDINAAEKKVFEVLTNISHDYWLAKSYLLLGDIYLQKGNTFQAKYTYMSIIENYEGDDEIKSTATTKYNSIIAKEEGENSKKIITTTPPTPPQNDNPSEFEGE
ncbi:MAG: tetratricopeptide repeat protein [Bacteroidales bacterium]|jgi:tol-pal system protein YbgF|nr:tetratricopeptide repeat protein [Bacteroidales bacterium]